MKNLFLQRCSLSLLILTLVLSSCVKDKTTHTYSIFTPVYKTKTEVRAGIASNAPEEIRTAGKLYVKGKYIFLNEIDKGIHIIDNTNPSQPKNVAFIDIPGNVDMAVKGNTMYADLYSDLVALDIADPLNVQVKKVVSNAFPHRRWPSMGFVADTSRVIVDWIKKDTTVTVSNDSYFPTFDCINCMVQFSTAAAAPKASSPIGVGGSMARFTIIRNTLYTVGDAELNVFSISTPENPLFSNKVPLNWGIETIYPFKDKLFIGSTTGMFIYDVTSESNPVYKGQFSHIRRCDPVIADDNYAYVTLRGGTACGTGAANQLDVLNISNLSAPHLVKSYQMTQPHGLSKDGNLLFICDGPDGLKVYDASNVNSIKLKRHIGGFESFDVIAMNNIAIVAEKRGLRQYDYSNADDIKLLSEINWKN